MKKIWFNFSISGSYLQFLYVSQAWNNRFLRIIQTAMEIDNAVHVLVK